MIHCVLSFIHCWFYRFLYNFLLCFVFCHSAKFCVCVFRFVYNFLLCFVIQQSFVFVFISFFTTFFCVLSFSKVLCLCSSLSSQLSFARSPLLFVHQLIYLVGTLFVFPAQNIYISSLAPYKSVNYKCLVSVLYILQVSSFRVKFGCLSCRPSHYLADLHIILPTILANLVHAQCYLTTKMFNSTE